MSVIKLNVGGVYYETTNDTLAKYHDSVLARMFSKEFISLDSLSPASQDKDGRYFIDRNGQLFGIILEFLRNGTIFLPANQRTSMDYHAIMNEAKYFGLDELVKLIEPYTHEEECEMETTDQLKIDFPFGVNIKDTYSNPGRLFVFRKCINCNEIYVETQNDCNSCKKPKKRTPASKSTSMHVDEGYSVDHIVKDVIQSAGRIQNPAFM